ncbi:MAG TPA: Fe-Mn family superoxide dismutase [Candidatus Paceibacterota bacterium]
MADKMIGISDKTMAIHKDKLYAGYVAKGKEVGDKLVKLRDEIIAGNVSGTNPTYSELRTLKDAENFATNAVYLHEWYFGVLEGDADWGKAPELSRALIEKWGSMEGAIKYMSECGMAARGWAVLCWDTKDGKLRQYNADAHNQGGVWGCLPIIVIDVYEHAYFIDFGSDRKAYIEAYWKNFNWQAAEAMYLKVKGLKF